MLVQGSLSIQSAKVEVEPTRTKNEVYQQRVRVTSMLPKRIESFSLINNLILYTILLHFSIDQNSGCFKCKVYKSHSLTDTVRSTDITQWYSLQSRWANSIRFFPQPNHKNIQKTLDKNIYLRCVLVQKFSFILM